MNTLFGVAQSEIEREMRAQLSDTPIPERAEPQVDRRTGITTAVRSRLSAGLRALAAAIEPRQPFTPTPSGSHR